MTESRYVAVPNEDDFDDAVTSFYTCHCGSHVTNDL